ncbi:MAG: aldo/keto reductase [Cyclobacteriaceae bacterium]
MNLQSFGKTGLSLPPIVFGSSAFGNLFHEYPLSLKKEILAEIFRQTAPYTVFDTAGKYGAGLALEVLGDFLQEQGIKKDEVIITNKLGWVRTELKGKEPTFEPGIWKGLQHDAVQKISYDGILECFEKDKALLRQNIPQLVSVHDPDEYLAGGKSKAGKEQRWQEILSAYKALEKLKSEGRIKGIGVGAKDWKTIRDIYQYIDLDYVMLANSLTLISHPPELMQFVENLRKNQVGIINAAVFQSGFLVGEDYFNYKLIDPNNLSDQAKINWRNQFFEVCRQYDVAPDHACIRFALRVPGISSVALSINNPFLVSKNMQAVKAELPRIFWDEMKNRKLIPDFAFL